MERSEGARSIDPRAVLDAGRAAGFDDCGIAPFGPAVSRARLDRWLAAGAHAGMVWMERSADVRRDPRRRWPWARSVLVGAVHYLTAPVDRARRRGLARHVARYALAEDYHDTVKRLLRDWAAAVERLAGRPLRTAPLVDTSAVLERECAVLAGVGWVGKNTCLIGPRGDSWRFLGLLLTDLAFPASSPPVTERCGSCRACLEACPTGALPEPYFLDARRCLSYWTIEHRGPIPEEMREGIGDWLFGCDICQEVCPWNRKVTPHGEHIFPPSERIERFELADLLHLDDAGFRRAFRGTPLARAKRAGIVRNALIVAANRRAADLEPLVAALVGDPDETVRETARWALARLRGGNGGD